jgi:hypothetical protein
MNKGRVAFLVAVLVGVAVWAGSWFVAPSSDTTAVESYFAAIVASDPVAVAATLCPASLSGSADPLAEVRLGLARVAEDLGSVQSFSTTRGGNTFATAELKTSKLGAVFRNVPFISEGRRLLPCPPDLRMLLTK